MTSPRDYLRDLTRSIGEALGMLRHATNATNDRVDIANSHTESIARDVAKIRELVHEMRSLLIANWTMTDLIHRQVCGEKKPTHQDWLDAHEQFRAAGGGQSGT